MIFAIGNSHANLFTNNHPAIFNEFTEREGFKSYAKVGCVAYHFYEHHLPWVKEVIEKHGQKDKIMLIIGEVDCRLHLPIQSEKQNRTPEDITQECVNRFFECVLELRKTNEVIGWGGHPCTNGTKIQNPENELSGTEFIRNKYYKLWNDLMKEKCDKNGVPFVTILRHLINSDGSTNTEYLDDFCHLKYTKAWPLIKRELNELNLL